MLMRCRQREPAKMAIRIERFFNSIFHVKKYLHIRQLSFAGFAGFVAAFFRLFHNYIFLCAAKISSCNILSFLCTSFFVPIRQYLKPLKGRIKKTTQLVCRLAFPRPILLASQRWWLHRKTTVPQTRTGKPARRPVYRLSRDSRYLQLFIHDFSNCVLLVFIRQLCRVIVWVG